MRVLLIDSFDGELFLSDVVNAYEDDCITVEWKDEDSDISTDFDFNSVLHLTTPLDDNLYIVMDSDTIDNVLRTILVNDYMDLTMYGNETFINPDDRDLERIKELASRNPDSQEAPKKIELW